MEGGTCGPLPFDSRLVSRPLGGGGAIEDCHGVEGEAMEDLDAAVVKGQSQT